MKSSSENALAITPHEGAGSRAVDRQRKTMEIAVLTVNSILTDPAEARQWFSPQHHEIAGVIGIEPAIELIRVMGGKTLYIPKPDQIAGSTLERLIGPELALKMAEHFDSFGLRMRIFNGPFGGGSYRRLLAMELFKLGWTLAEVAHEMRCARSTVSLWKKAMS